MHHLRKLFGSRVHWDDLTDECKQKLTEDGIVPKYIDGYHIKQIGQARFEAYIAQGIPLSTINGLESSVIRSIDPKMINTLITKFNMPTSDMNTYFGFLPGFQPNMLEQAIVAAQTLEELKSNLHSQADSRFKKILNKAALLSDEHPKRSKSGM